MTDKPFKPFNTGKPFAPPEITLGEKLGRRMHSRERLLYGFYATPDIVPAAQYDWEALPENLKEDYLSEGKDILQDILSYPSITSSLLGVSSYYHLLCIRCKGIIDGTTKAD